MTRERILAIMDLVDEANKEYPTVQASITIGHSVYANVYNSRKGTGSNAESWFFETETYYMMTPGEVKVHPNDKTIRTMFDPFLEGAEEMLRNLIETREVEDDT